MTPSFFNFDLFMYQCKANRLISGLWPSDPLTDEMAHALHIEQLSGLRQPD